MNVTKKQFKALEDVMSILPHGEDFKKLNKREQNILNRYVAVLNELVDKRKKDNKRIADYIAKKRKIDPKYARSKEH